MNFDVWLGFAGTHICVDDPEHRSSHVLRNRQQVQWLIDEYRHHGELLKATRIELVLNDSRCRL